VRRSDGSLSGPLVVGSRLITSDAPMDYRLLIYEKGAFVLHMLRTMLMDLDTGDDTRFRELMRTFVADHLHGVASTRSFETAVTEAFGESMAWFFDQWVYGVDVPTYRPDLEVTETIDQDYPFILHGTIRQEDVPGDFRMPVPIVVQFDDHPPLVQRVWVEGQSVEVEIPLPAEPREVEFNYHYGVLARVR
jgi:aminopeptidase N